MWPSFYPDTCVLYWDNGHLKNIGLESFYNIRRSGRVVTIRLLRSTGERGDLDVHPEEIADFFVIYLQVAAPHQKFLGRERRDVERE